MNISLHYALIYDDIFSLLSTLHFRNGTSKKFQKLKKNKNVQKINFSNQIETKIQIQVSWSAFKSVMKFEI